MDFRNNTGCSAGSCYVLSPALPVHVPVPPSYSSWCSAFDLASPATPAAPALASTPAPDLLLLLMPMPLSSLSFLMKARDATDCIITVDGASIILIPTLLLGRLHYGLSGKLG